MKWTKEPPTVPGWYWWYWPNTKQLDILQIKKLKSGKVFASGIEGDEFMKMPAYWLGPLPVPEKPEV